MQRPPPGRKQPRKGPRSSEKEQGREEPFVRLLHGERGSLTPHLPLGFPFTMWTEGGLGGSVLLCGGNPASKLRVLLGADSRYETPRSPVICQSISQPPAHGGGLGGIQVRSVFQLAS